MEPFKTLSEFLRFIVIAGSKLLAPVDFDFFNVPFSPAFGFEESVPPNTSNIHDAGFIPSGNACTFGIFCKYSTNVFPFAPHGPKYT